MCVYVLYEYISGNRGRKWRCLDCQEIREYLTKVRNSGVCICTCKYLFHRGVYSPYLIPKPVKLSSTHPTIRKVRIHVSMPIGRSYSEICIDLYMYWILPHHYRGKCNFSINTKDLLQASLLWYSISHFVSVLKPRSNSKEKVLLIAERHYVLESPGSRYRNKEGEGVAVAGGIE